MKPLRIIIYERQRLISECLHLSLHAQENIAKIQNTTQLSDLLKQMSLIAPDVLVISLDEDFLLMDALPAIRRSSPRTNILLVAPNIPNRGIFDTIQRNNLSYLNKDTSSYQDLHKAILSAGHTQIYRDKSLTIQLAELLHQTDEALTTREIDVLKHLAAGFSNAEIAHTLNITTETVKTHVSNVYLKINVTKRTEAVVYAFKNNLITRQSNKNSF